MVKILHFKKHPALIKNQSLRQSNLFYLGIASLQLLVDVVGAGDLENVLGSLLGGVSDLAVVNDEGVTVGTALSVGPADALGELGLRVGQEQL